MKTKSIATFFILIALLIVSAVGVAAQEDDATTEDAPPVTQEDRGRRGHGPMVKLLDIVAEETGLTAEELREQLRDGATMAEVIADNGGDVDAVMTTAVDAMTEMINAAVEAGDLPAEVAERMLKNLEQRITDALNGERPERPGGPGNGGPGDGRPGGRPGGPGNGGPGAPPVPPGDSL